MRVALLPLLLLFALVSCTTLPVPSAYRQAKIDDGIEKGATLGEESLRYWDRGEGPVIVLLHGLGGSLYDWRFLFDDFVAAGYRVLALETMGAGYSDKPVDGDYSISAHGLRLLRFLDHLDIPKAHFVGNSWGGGMALFVALNEPERVGRLALLAPASMPQPSPLYLRILRTPVLRELAVLGFGLMPKSMAARMGLGLVYHDDDKICREDVDEYAHETRFPGVMRAMVRTANQLDFGDLLEYAREFRKITAPTLILWGENDGVISLSAGKALHEEMPHSSLFIYPECGHVPHMEYPGITRDLILDFLEAGEVTERN
jgi:4,5:9,10-diseco-3-hydroxy-5,9,17-trioxoandrosta-1(10),2-diene-4-oate hydrolase